MTTENTIDISNTKTTHDKFNISSYENYIYFLRNDRTDLYRIPTPSLSLQYYTPFNTVSFDAGNTKVFSSGTLAASILDPSNNINNGVYYEYSVNGNGYVNSGVYAGTSPNTVYVLSTDISNTILVRAKNTAGNSTPISLLPVPTIIYQKPRAPAQVSYTSLGRGNVQVSINESATTPPNFYYLNNVSYYLYAYNTFGGTNLSGNTSTLIYNIPVGVLANTNSTYSNIVSYVNTGLTANTYTMYVIAKNDVGNSNPVFANIYVLTTPYPPSSIDIGNTKSMTSGNLTISINDTRNSPLNGVYYLYSLDGINYGNSRTFLGENTRTVFTVSDTGNSQVPLTAGTYTLYIASADQIGNSTPITAPVQVYTTPQSPTIDATNTQSISSGNLTVVINDAVNSATNGVYYFYSTDGITYGNSGVLKTAATTYTFTINNTGNSQIPLVANTYTLYVAAVNSVGNSISSPATAVESVYTTPLAPIIDQGNTKSVTSGNLNVAFTDPSNNANNQVEYTYLMYDPTIQNKIFYL